MRFRTAEKKHNAEGEVHRMFLDGFKAYRWRNKIEGKRVELSQLRVVWMWNTFGFRAKKPQKVLFVCDFDHGRVAETPSVYWAAACDAMSHLWLRVKKSISDVFRCGSIYIWELKPTMDFLIFLRVDWRQRERNERKATRVGMEVEGEKCSKLGNIHMYQQFSWRNFSWPLAKILTSLILMSSFHHFLYLL